MKYSVECLCGYETPAVENKKDVDYELLDAHQMLCPLILKLEEE
jgi:hypothetical protein